jgi:serine/threonine protein kinase
MADKQGYLTKEGGSFKSWKKRWCVLKNGALHYSKSQNSSDLGIIKLDKATDIKATEYKKKKYCFQIQTPERVYFMQADLEKDRDSWVALLVDARDRLQGQGKYVGTVPPVSNGTTSSNGTSETKQNVTMEDFDLLKVIGKGSFGKVFQVKKKDNQKIYAMKVLNKKAIIERNELEHTKAEKNILQKLVHPFLVNLYFSFQTEDKVVFVMDYVNGGELFFHLQKDRKFPEDRVRFYIAEIVLGLEYLHDNGVLYRDLKPENLLLTDEGHICMTDFGISKEGLESDDARTATFCGTPEYLAPEVLECNGYGKAVDWWSLGTLMFEMLTGLPPFYCQDVQVMYSKIMHAKLEIPGYISKEAAQLLTGLLERDPEKRLSDARTIKVQPFFLPIDFEKLQQKQITPPFIPPVSGPEDLSQIDDTFTSEPATFSLPEDSTISSTLQGKFEGFTFVAGSEINK